MTIRVVPASVGDASRRWDDEHLDLASAATLIGDAGSDGFTTAVSGNAARFLSTWQRLAEDSGENCEAQADALRGVIRDFLASDRAVFEDFVDLSGFVEERR